MVQRGSATLAVVEMGPLDAPPVLLIHGYPDCHDVWCEVWPRLAANHRVIAYDVRGAGRSSRPAGDAAYDLAELADDAAAVIDAMSPGRPVHVVGHDWGAIQAWELVTTARAEGRVASFTSISGPSLDHVGHWVRGAMRSGAPGRMAAVLGQASRSWYIGALRVPGVVERTWTWLAPRWAGVRAFAEGAETGPAAATLAQDGVAGAALYRRNVARRLRRPRHDGHARAPVQVVVPTRDRFVSRALAIGAAQPWVRELVVREVDAGHWVPRSHPEPIARAIAEQIVRGERYAARGWTMDAGGASRSGASGAAGPANRGNAPSAAAGSANRGNAPSGAAGPANRASAAAGPAIRGSVASTAIRGSVASAASRGSVAITAIRPRRVQFLLDDVALEWIPGDPFAGHLIDVLHLLLPAGERWFVDVYREALPLVRDEHLRADVRGFMGQEATHARAHDAVLEHLRAVGVETEPFTRRVEWMFGRVFGARPPAGVPLSPRAWLEVRLGGIAAVEHFTCVLGRWVIERSAALDAAGADATMLALLRWHGAEEIEHRSVAFDTLVHIAGWRAYGWRAVGMALAVPIMTALWARGTQYFLQRDPALAGRQFGYRDFVRAAQRRRAPGLELISAIPRFMRPGYHPEHEASSEVARAYLARDLAR